MMGPEEDISPTTLNLNWNDCGDPSYHAHVTGLTPASMELGQATHVTGTGPLDETVSAGTFSISLKVGPLPAQIFTGNVCKAKMFTLPLKMGTIKWDGMPCPVAAGTTSVPTTITLSSNIPAMLLNAALTITATGSNGDKLFCLDMLAGMAGTVLV
jgi:outer membrane protein assembly factor BamB